MSVYVRLACKSRNIQRVKELTEYILDPIKTRPEYCHAIGLDLERAYEDVIFVKQLHCQTEGRQVLHWILSCDKGVTAEKADRVGEEVLHLLEGKYQALCATHLNTQNYHTHIMVNPIDMETGLKFSESKGELIKFRDKVNVILKNHGMKSIGEAIYMEDEEWDENHEYSENCFEGDQNEIFDEMEHVYFKESSTSEAETEKSEKNVSLENSHEEVKNVWQQTWIHPEIFSGFDSGSYNIKTFIDGNIFEGNLCVEGNRIMIPGVMNQIEVQQPKLIRGVTYDDTPDNQFEVSQYVHGEKFSGRGKSENGKLLIPGILYSES